ncbi:DUF55-domain-containing protein [Pseudovirgaria hyperparasitica]|uniref:DUF55-domain-containing protein n=1 Tax=Pseudovirgaria hyperparasitica TaxID=470096 RepID=A0A6A6W2K7_9PEZI|nr:DUF55-domain-containing protein [Pseudovirgaria hyperparasitica]KAF2756266.1 DUF55-domain-containing protein [Pseudovirgaria hyperparasitica]
MAKTRKISKTSLKSAEPPPKRAGRPRKATVAIEKASTAEPPVRRSTRARSAAAPANKSLSPPPPLPQPPRPSSRKRKADESIEPPVLKKARGRPKVTSAKPVSKPKRGDTAVQKSTTKARAIATKPAAKEAAAPERDHDRETAFWLMKAEPDSRIVKGQDVAFSVDDLANCEHPESWDGVRNREARNNMQKMKKGDKAFFYHSNTRNPGIVGVMVIVEEAGVDSSAFDKEHPYYDAKSNPQSPTWYCVKVALEEKLKSLVSLDMLKAHRTGALSSMEALTKTRLSVQKVSPAEWEFVLSLAKDAAAAAAAEHEADLENAVESMSDLEELTGEEAAELPQVSNGDLQAELATADRMLAAADETVDNSEQHGVTQFSVNAISASALLEPHTYLATEEREEFTSINLLV